MPERILRGQLAGAGVPAELGRSGEHLVLAGPRPAGARLEVLLDRSGPGGIVLDELLVQAAGGLMGVHGRARGHRPDAARPDAARLGVDYVTVAASVILAQGVLAALLARCRGTRVSGVTASLAGTALLTVSQYLAAATADEPDLMAHTEPGHPPPFCSADGVRFELESLDPEPWRRLWTGLGIPDAVAGRAWRPFMLRYATAVAPLPADLHAATRGLSFTGLRDAAAAAGVAVQPLRSGAERRRDLAGHDPFDAPWTITTPGRPGAGNAAGAAWPDGAPGPEGAPGPDGATGLAAGPLAGLVVVEAGRRVQSPLAGQVLRMLGAEVVRIEPPGGDPLRGMPPMAGDCSARFLALNRGKRLVEADLRTPAGRATVLAAARDADAFLHNWAPGKAAELGLDHSDLAAVNPRLVFAYASGWGDVLGADPPPGTDFMVQAYAGLGEHLVEAGQPPAGSLMTLLDVLGGLVAASGVLAGLLGRERDGCGRRVDSSLLSAATLLQAPILAAEARRHAPEAPDRTPLGVPLPAADADIVLGRGTQPSRAATALGVDDPADIPAVISANPAAGSLALLTAAGIDAVRVCADPGELAEDPWAAALLERDGCAFVRPPWTFSA